MIATSEALKAERQARQLARAGAAVKPERTLFAWPVWFSTSFSRALEFRPEPHMPRRVREQRDPDHFTLNIDGGGYHINCLPHLQVSSNLLVRCLVEQQQPVLLSLNQLDEKTKKCHVADNSTVDRSLREQIHSGFA